MVEVFPWRCWEQDKAAIEDANAAVDLAAKMKNKKRGRYYSARQASTLCPLKLRNRKNLIRLSLSNARTGQLIYSSERVPLGLPNKKLIHQDRAFVPLLRSKDFQALLQE